MMIMMGYQPTNGIPWDIYNQVRFGVLDKIGGIRYTIKTALLLQKDAVLLGWHSETQKIVINHPDLGEHRILRTTLFCRHKRALSLFLWDLGNCGCLGGLPCCAVDEVQKRLVRL